MALTEKMWKAEVDAAIQEDRQRIENLSSAIGSGEMLLANTIDKDIQALERKEEILWKIPESLEKTRFSGFLFAFWVHFEYNFIVSV